METDPSRSSLAGAVGVTPVVYADDPAGIRIRGGYLPVPLMALRVSSDRPFHLYARKRVDNALRYVLYRAPQTALHRETLDRLAANRVEFLYIRTADHRQYTRYLELNLDQSMSDPALNHRQQTQILYVTAVRILEEIFADPDQDGQIRRVLPIVDHIVDRVLSDSSVLSSLASMNCHDYYTATHMVNVSGYMAALAVAGGIVDRNVLREVTLGGLLHDLGKVRISPQILNKPGRLDDEEWAVIRQHPAGSVAMASAQMTLADTVRSILGDHHEKLDGSGYPRGLSGDRVTQFARMAAICDVFDALTSHRDYRRIMTGEQALAMMSETVGTHLDAPWYQTWCSVVSGNIDARHWPPAAIENVDRDDEREIEIVKPPPVRSAANRRRHARRRFRAPVVLRDLGAGPAIRDVHAGVAIDLSRGGMNMVMPTALAPGTRVQVVLPDFPPMSRPLISRVVRTDPIRDGRFVTALEFEMSKPPLPERVM